MQTGVHWGLEGHPKAGNTGAMPWLDRHFHIRIACSKFDTVKVLNIKVLFFLYLQASYKIYKICTIRISRYTVDAAQVFNQLFILFFMQAGGGLGARLTF